MLYIILDLKEVMKKSKSVAYKFAGKSAAG